MRSIDPQKRSIALRRNIVGTFALRVLLGSLAFVVPTIVLLWKQNGMSMQDITLLQALFAGCLAVFELPTGYFADALGRKRAIRLAALLLVAGASTYFVADSFMLFLLGEVLLALGFSFMSGADQALLYDTLLELGRAEEFPKLWGRACFWAFIVAAFSAIIGGYAGAMNLRLPLLLEIGATLIICVIAFRLIEPQRKGSTSERASARDLVRVFAGSLGKDSGVRWLILYPALLFGLNQVAVWLYAPYFKLTGVETQYFGLIFALFNVTAALASRYAERLERVCGEMMSMVLPLVCLIVSYLLLGNIVFILSFSFALLQQMVRGYTSVIYAHRLNKSISSDRRATILSLQSMAGRVAYAILLLPVGYLADHGGLLLTFQATGAAAFLLGSLALMVRYGRA